MNKLISGEKPSPVMVWILAARPKTLPAGIVPVLVGGVIAFAVGRFAPWPFLAALFGSVMIQVGTNFANDLFDYRKRADGDDRIGPLRVTQAGLATPRQTAIAAVVAYSLATLAGLYLFSVAGWPVLIIGLSSLACGLLYTAGPWALGYLGLGDLFVLVFFGPVALAGTYFVQTLTMTTEIVLAGIPFGMISVAILTVNNLRDIEADRRSGKKTLAVRFGRTFARYEYTLMLLGAGLMPPLLSLCGYQRTFMLVTVGFLLFAPPAIRAVFTRTEGEILNGVLAATGRLLIIYGLLFSIGWLL